MNQVPHITVELLNKALNAAKPQADGKYSVVDVFNAAQKLAEANAEQEQPLISAEEARELVLAGGIAEWQGSAPCWIKCDKEDVFNDTFLDGRKCKYRAIKPEPVEPHAELKGHLKHLEIAGVWVVCNEPTCQIKNLDTGVTETMTRDKAKLLQAELGDTVEWWMELQTPRPKTVSWHPVGFDQKGIYTYKRKVKPLKQVSWKDVPVGVMTNKGELREVYEAIYGDERLQAVVEVSMPVAGKKTCQCEFYCKDLTLAPASEQRSIAVQDLAGLKRGTLEKVGFKVEYKKDEYGFLAAYRITGLAEGYELK